jgi:hypothetical protein
MQDNYMKFEKLRPGYILHNDFDYLVVLNKTGDSVKIFQGILKKIHKKIFRYRTSIITQSTWDSELTTLSTKFHKSNDSEIRCIFIRAAFEAPQDPN